MAMSRVIRHGNYELLCGANAVDGGRFVPTVVVTKQVWPTRPRTVAVQPVSFPTEESAVDAARLQGIEWIANYG